MKEIEINLMDSVPYVRYVAKYRSEPGIKYHVPWRVIYDFEIIFVTDGEMVVEERGEQGESRYYLKKSDFHVMEPLVRHTRIIEDGAHCTYYTVHFDFFMSKFDKNVDVDRVYLAPIIDFMDETDVDKELSERNVYKIKDISLKRIFHVKDATRMEVSFERMFRLFNRKDEVLDFQLRGNFITLLGILFEEMRDESYIFRIQDAIEHFCHYVYEYIATEISVEKFARSCGFSPVYFRKEFRKRKGITPGEYLQNERMGLAKKLLREGIRVTDVAPMVGYADICYFSKAFKKRCGTSPSDYAKKTQDKTV